MNLFYLFLTLAIGSVFGLAAAKMKIPGGLMVGAIVGVAALNIFFGTTYIPKQTKLFVQIIAGAFIGCVMEKSDVKRLPKIVQPAIIMLLGLLVLNLSAGFLIYVVSPLDLVTSLMSVVPGGISDTPIIAADMGADAPKIAVMQTVRQILGIGVFPALILAYDNRKKAIKKDGEREAYTEKRKKSKTKSWQSFVCTLIIAAIAGILGKMTGIPSGSFVFPIIAVLILKLVFDFAYIPRWAKKCAQVLSGCYLGSTIVLDDVLELRYLLIPLIIIVLGYMANCFFTGMIIKKTCGFTRKESMLITTPAGASDMALISADMGVENTDVIIMQVLRAVIVMTFFPQIINLIVYLIGA
ncbi:AbrB family transcriptional regulator [Clostridium sp. DJ247]|uniref:AbrB family transcriptional regulator n=1 Tax=Clostridium sp. DJ247 TaxID=2726188 RepID=UPI001628ABAA|nr:AbrB family transcriptional regulator [Clostridium sp. DJ247]MBC2578763.1 membrane-spanning protein [Clostridium sp. DJ247]